MRLKALQLAIFAFAFGLDRFTKLNFASWSSRGVLSFEAHRNPGFILQSFENASSWSRVVFVASLYGFIFFAFFFLEWFLPRSVKQLRIYLTLFAASITGNFYDRAFDGAVLDFIVVRSPESLVYFNVADVFMWLALGGILVELFRSSEAIFHPREKRKQWLVDGQYQFRTAIQTGLVTVSATFILNLFTYFSVVSSTAKPLAIPVMLTGTSLGLLFSAVSVFFSFRISHRSAGPLFAFEKYVEALLRGENPKFSLREKDEHKNLIQLAEKLKLRLEEDQNENQDITIRRKSS